MKLAGVTTDVNLDVHRLVKLVSASEGRSSKLGHEPQRRASASNAVNGVLMDWVPLVHSSQSL